MSGNWTPGPWRVEQGTTLIWGDCKTIDVDGFDRMGKPVASAEHEKYWARVDSEKMAEGEVEANARLMAAAPDLAEALEALLGALETRGIELDWMSSPTPLIRLLNTESEEATVERARAALAKAKGESA